MFPLSRIISRAAMLYARDPAVVDGPVRMSYATLARRVRALAAGLLAQGLVPGDRVAILGRNSFRYLEVNLACAEAGLILIPLNIRLAPPEIEAILAATEARLVLAGLPYDGTAAAVLAWDDAEPPGADTRYERLIAESAPLDGPVETALGATAQIFFTSGTTGEPKGACLTQQNLVASALDSIVAMELSHADIWFHAPPMFHLVDAFAIWAITLVGGVHVIAHFDPLGFGPLVEAERVTKTSLPPTLLDMIVTQSPIAAYDLASLDRISYGGSPMPEAVYRRVTEGLGCDLLQAYGITETSGMVCQQVPRDLHRGGIRNSVGQPVASIDLRIVDDGGRVLPPGAIGEMEVAGPRVMSGYWRNPKATEAAFHDGWYRTGDLGIGDEDGHFTIVGRKKDMVISGGENVYPTEVEDALAAHPAVAEAAVFGVPSPRWGEEVRGVVFLKPGTAASPAELIEHCRTRIGGYKVPKRIDISAEPLPKSGPGKIAKAAVRAAHLQQFPQ